MKEQIKHQIKLELHHTANNATQLMRTFLHPFHNQIEDAANNLMLYLMLFNEYEYEAQGEVRTREDLVEVHDTLLNSDLVELMYRLLTPVVHKGEVTLQQGVGSIVGSFSGMSSMSRQLKAANLLIERTPFITVDITKGGEYGYLVSQIELDESEKLALSQQSVALPSLVPLRKLRNNSSIGYRTFRKSVVMGGKHHNFDMCLNHLNKRNRVAFKLDPEIVGRVLKGVLGTFDPTPKYNKKTAKTETAVEVEERKNAWLALYAHYSDKVKAIGTNTFYFGHRRDNRGRTYCEAYHLNYQGSDEQKASISLAHEEVIACDF